MKCDRCGKGVLVGMNVSHSHVRTKKRSYPNLHPFKIKVGGVTKRLRLCTKCLRIVKKGSSPNVQNKIKPQRDSTPAANENVKEKMEVTKVRKSNVSKKHREAIQTPQA